MSYIEQYGEVIAKMGLPYTEYEIEAVVSKHAWFTTARILRSAITKRDDPKLGIALLINPTPKPLLKSVSLSLLIEQAEDGSARKELRSQMNNDIIEAFLSSDASGRRVVPNPEAEEYDAAEQSGVVEITEEMLSQELVDIYRKQGLTELADKIISLASKREKTE